MFAGVWLMVVAFVVSGTVLLLVNGGKLTAVQLGPSFVAAFAVIGRGRGWFLWGRFSGSCVVRTSMRRARSKTAKSSFCLRP